MYACHGCPVPTAIVILELSTVLLFFSNILKRKLCTGQAEFERKSDLEWSTYRIVHRTPGEITAV